MAHALIWPPVPRPPLVRPLFRWLALAGLLVFLTWSFGQALTELRSELAASCRANVALLYQIQWLATDAALGANTPVYPWQAQLADTALIQAALRCQELAGERHRLIPNSRSRSSSRR